MKKVVFFILTLLAVNSFGQVNLNSGLHICYPFNGNATDFSGLSNHGTIGGATPTSDRFSNPSGALLFNGISDFVRLNNVLPDMSRFSISVWVYHTKPSGTSAIFCDSDTYAYEDMYFTMTNVWLGTTADKSGGTLNSGISTSPLSSAWHHLVWVCDSNVQRFYIDTVLAGTLNIVGRNVGYHNIQASIGQMGDAPGNNNYYNFFQGKMDDFRLYTRAVTQVEVNALYHASCGCAAPDAAAAVTGGSIACLGSANVYSIVPVAGATYSWSLPNGWTGSSATNTISGTPGNAGIVSVTITSACSVSSVFTLAVSVHDCATAIKTNISNDQNELVMYPNPNDGNFTIEAAENSEVCFTNFLGQIISTERITIGGNKIDLSNYPSGIYFGIVKQNTATKTFKFIIE
jgi:hypothetical protein